MFSRFVSMTLKPNVGQDFMNALQNSVLPILRAQRGFRDEMLFVEPGSPEAVAISLWDSKESADKYVRTVFPEVLNLLSPFLEGDPKAEPYQLVFSTAHRLPAGVPLQDPNTTPVPGVGG